MSAAIGSAAVVESDGVWINQETGEVLDVVGRGSDWQPETIADAEWVLERLMNRRVEITRLKAKRDQITGFIAAQIAEQERLEAGLLRRFASGLEAFARRELETQGWRTKTLRTSYGQIAFRIVKGTHKITDQLAAIAWAKRCVPTAVKIAESVNVSDLLPHLDDGEAPPWLETTAGGEKCTIVVERES